MHQAEKRKAPGGREAPGARRTSIQLRRHISESTERVKKNVPLVFRSRFRYHGDKYRVTDARVQARLFLTSEDRNRRAGTGARVGIATLRSRLRACARDDGRRSRLRARRNGPQFPCLTTGVHSTARPLHFRCICSEGCGSAGARPRAPGGPDARDRPAGAVRRRSRANPKTRLENSTFIDLP
jgi:hypothetical protein